MGGTFLPRTIWRYTTTRPDYNAAFVPMHTLSSDSRPHARVCSLSRGMTRKRLGSSE